MLSIRNADIFKANFYYYYPIIITMTFVILQTFHADEMVSLVTDIKKTHLFNFILSWILHRIWNARGFSLGTSIC